MWYLIFALPIDMASAICIAAGFWQWENSEYAYSYLFFYIYIFIILILTLSVESQITCIIILIEFIITFIPLFELKTCLRFHFFVYTGILRSGDCENGLWFRLQEIWEPNCLQWINCMNKAHCKSPLFEQIRSRLYPQSGTVTWGGWQPALRRTGSQPPCDSRRLQLLPWHDWRTGALIAPAILRIKEALWSAYLIGRSD